MDATPLLHKPVFYGSALANSLFLAVVFLHILAALLAPLSSVVALAAQKGGRAHLQAGKLFVRAMVTLALTGILLDVVRLSFFLSENHTKYAGLSMPSSYPARISFLFAALCTLYLLSEARTPRKPAVASGALVLLPGLLLVLGGALTALIVVRFNPWTGALWMIWTFMLLVGVCARYRLRRLEARAGLSRHKMIMGLLGGFSWWGALQGFGPAIGIAFVGVNRSMEPYRGDQPGPFSPSFLVYLLVWALPFLVALFWVAPFSKQRPSKTV